MFVDETSEDDFLSPDVAFQLNVTPTDAQSLRADFKVEPGYYLYKQRIQFKVQAPAGAEAQAELPAGEMKNDPNFGPQEVYHHDFSAKVGVASTDNLALKVTYQAVAKKAYATPHKPKPLILALQTPHPPLQVVTISKFPPAKQQT